MMRVAVIGGSSPSTPVLALSLASQPMPSPLELRLFGRDPRALEAIERACHFLVAESALRVSTHSVFLSDWQAHLEGIDVALIQIRVGGYEGREFDESFPLRFGMCGDEGLGPGGLSAAWRTWPVLLTYLEALCNSAPAATVLLLASPVGILTRACRAQRCDLEIAGICELPWTTLLRVCATVNVDPSDVDFDYIGVNHLGWLYRIES